MFILSAIITSASSCCWIICGQGGFPLPQERHLERFYSAEFSHDGKDVLTACGQIARIWNSETGDGVLRIEGHTDDVFHATYSADGRWIATASADGTAKIWNAATAKLVASFLNTREAVYTANFSPDGRRLIATCSDDATKVWEISTASVIFTLEGVVFSAAYSPDGTQIVTAGTCVRIWDAAGGKKILEFGESGEDWISSVQYSPDGLRIVTSSEDETARVWDSRTGRELTRLEGHGGWVFSAQFDKSGRRIVTASRDGTARVWDSRTGRLLMTLRGHDDIVCWASFSPDGSKVVTASIDGSAGVWDAKSGKLLRWLRRRDLRRALPSAHEPSETSAQSLRLRFLGSPALCKRAALAT